MEISLAEEFMIQVLAGLIVSAIVGAFSAYFILYRCVHKQAAEIKMIKKANAVVIGMFVRQTKKLHPEESADLAEIEKIYEKLMKDDSSE